MQVMIERCQTMELEANNLSHHVKDTLPTDLKVIEARIDQRCSALLEIKSDSDASKLVGLKTSFNTQLGSLKGKIDAIQNKLDIKNSSFSTQDHEQEIEILVSRKIDQIDFPSKIQKELCNTNFVEVTDETYAGLKQDVNELKTKTDQMEVTLNAEDLKEEVNEGVVEKLVEKKVKEVDFSTKMQLDFQNLLKATDPVITTMQTDVRNVCKTANTNKGSIMKIEQQLGPLSSQNNSFTPISNQHPSPAPPPVPPILPSQLPGIPAIPLLSEHMSSHHVSKSAHRDLQRQSNFSSKSTSLEGQNNQRMSPSPSSSVRNNVDQHHNTATGTLELLLCFDSNGRHIDRKKLWKKNNSEYKRCATLHRVSEEIKNLQYKDVQHVLLSVGTNDLDTKDYDQVLGELKLLIHDIRDKYPRVKIVINEFLPRNDERNGEVEKFNYYLERYAKLQQDITVASQADLTDISVLSDAKHLLPDKVPRYAKNIIKALLTSYGIESKQELFARPTFNNARETNANASERRSNVQERLAKMADYGDERYNPRFTDVIGNSNKPNKSYNDDQLCDTLAFFGNLLQKLIQR